MSSVVIPERRLPIVIRLMGGTWRDGRRSYRMKWGELSVGKRGVAIDLCSFEDHFSLHLAMFWISAFINLRFLKRWHKEPKDMMTSWGFSLSPENGLHIHLTRDRTKIITLPWRDWVHLGHDVRRPDGSWVPFVGSWEEKGKEIMRADGAPAFEGKDPDGRHVEAHEYHYMLRSGEVQTRIASIYVERWTRALRWLQWIPFARRRRYGISVSFNDEVGERTGSWKGGVVGCSYSLNRNETPLECLRRMERERRFT